jgi:type IV pilus assembly protein PilW
MSSRIHPWSNFRQRGVSLIELMIALVIGLILLGGLIQIYLSTKQSYNAQEQLARMQESGRFAMDVITRDLRRSGYWGGNVDTATVTGDPGRVLNPTNACIGTADVDWGRMITWRVSGLNNANADYGCATGYDTDLNSDILTVRYAGPEPLAALATLENDRLYMRSTLFAGRLMTGKESASAENLLPPDDPDTPAHLFAQVRPVVSHSYFIGVSDNVCAGQPIPGLFRVRLDAAGTPGAVEEIAPGIEQLQVRYLHGGSYVDAGTVGNDWVNVRAVRVWLLARGQCPEPGLNSTIEYPMGDVTWPPAPDNFRRQLYVSTIMLRNMRVR